MSIRIRNVLGAVVLVGASTLITSEVVSRQHDDAQTKQMEEMYDAWMKYAEPGPEHAHLARFTGKWDQVNSHWMYEGADPMVSTSVSTYKPILGGRFMMQHMNGEMEWEGEKTLIEGLCFFGYDRFAKKHMFVWADTMGTMMMIGEGTADPTGKIVTYKSEMPNPMTGGMTPVKCVSTLVNENKSLFEMYEDREGEWFRTMEIASTRTGGGLKAEHGKRELHRATGKGDYYDND